MKLSEFLTELKKFEIHQNLEIVIGGIKYDYEIKDITKQFQNPRTKENLRIVIYVGNVV